VNIVLFGVNIGNDCIQCLQYLFYVVGIAFGNNSDQLIKPVSAVFCEIPAYHLHIGSESRNAIEENHRTPLETADNVMPPINLNSPRLHNGQKISLPVFHCALGSGVSLQLLGMQTPSVSHPSGSQPTSTSQSNGECVGHWAIYFLFLAVSAGFAWQIGYASRLTKKAEPPPTRGVNRDSGTASANGGWLRRLVRRGEFKFVVRQLGRGCSPDISVSTQAPSSYGVRVCIETEMSYFMQTVANQMHVLSHYKVELKRQFCEHDFAQMI
jgi:hypothetical protein